MSQVSPLLSDGDETPLLEKNVSRDGSDDSHTAPPVFLSHGGRRRGRWYLAVLVACSLASTWFAKDIFGLEALWTPDEEPMAPIDSELQQEFSVNLTHSVEEAIKAEHLSETILANKTPRVDWTSATTVEELDRLACGRDGCRFMVVGAVGEQVGSIALSTEISRFLIVAQNTKADLHLAQIAFMASQVNRTLVLPNIAGGRYSTCFEHPFDLYHDPADVARMFDVDVLLWHDFARYTTLRAQLAEPLSVHRIAVKREGKTHKPKAIHRGKSQSRKQTCLPDAQLDMETFNPTILSTGSEFFADHNERVAFGQWLLNTLDQPALSRGALSKGREAVVPDVYHVLWDISVRLFDTEEPNAPPQQGPTIPFHPRWNALADQIADSISPAVALHWRQETLEKVLKKMPDYVACAKAAETRLEEFRDDLKTVYFMTDFPLNGDVHSETYLHDLDRDPQLKKAAQAGIDELLSWRGFFADKADAGRNIPKVVTIDGLKLHAPLEDGRQMPIKDIDAGLLGVIDKLVAERTELYLVGRPFACARLSNFSVQLVRERRKRIKTPGDRLLSSDVIYFPVDGQTKHVYKRR